MQNRNGNNNPVHGCCDIAVQSCYFIPRQHVLSCINMAVDLSRWFYHLHSNWSCIFRNWSRFGSYNVYLHDTRISYTYLRLSSIDNECKCQILLIYSYFCQPFYYKLHEFLPAQLCRQTTKIFKAIIFYVVFILTT